MKYSEKAYIEAGYTFERASTPQATQARARIIRQMLETEKPHDQTEARELIETGRKEARLTLH